MTLLQQLTEFQIIYTDIIELIKNIKQQNPKHSNELSQQQTDLLHYNQQLKSIDTKRKALTLELGTLKITDALLKASSSEELQKIAEQYMPNFLLKGYPNAGK